MEAIEIRKIRKDEIPLIKDFAPPGWNSDLGKIWNQYYDKDFFYPLVAAGKGEILGTGMAIIHENAAWLGHIIVTEKYRNRGIGSAITKKLIELPLNKKIDSVLLTASDSGLPIYKKLGFQVNISYIFFKPKNFVRTDHLNEKITPALEEDYDNIFQLDYNISGEKREKLLATALSTGFKYKDMEIEGFYLPDFGKGLIIADSEIAGTELLKFRFSLDQSAICIPESNQTAIKLVNSLGFFEYSKIPRMFLNRNVQWHPEKVYSRGCGYMG